MSAAQPQLSVPIDDEPRTSVRVQLGPSDDHDRFADYLRRLGCTVVADGAGTFDVSVGHESVGDETPAIAEWCESWSAVHAPAYAVVTAAAGPATTALVA